MSSYLQIFLDETDDELEALVEVLLQLETTPDEINALNEAFRLLHSLKGSSGMMGFEGVSELAHQLENRFEMFRSGKATLDRSTMNVLLECVDFLRTFSTSLRAGDRVSDDASHLIAQLNAIGQPSSARTSAAPLESAPASADLSETVVAAPVEGVPELNLDAGYRVRVTFEKGLQLADLKARLIVARLSNIGDIVASEPSVDDIESFEEVPQFVVIVLTNRSPAEIRDIANVDGVDTVDIEEGSSPAVEKSSSTPETVTPVEIPRHPEDTVELSLQELDSGADLTSTDSEADGRTEEEVASISVGSTPSPEPSAVVDVATSDPALPKVAETVRVEIDRLDRLMNLTGELVVTKARFTQIAGEMSPQFRNANIANRVKDLGERLRLSLQKMRELASQVPVESRDWRNDLEQLEEDIEGLDEQSALWEEGRGHFSQVAEAVDQLSRVSDKLQHGVLDTRMVPVGPLFNRFKRVIRDLSIERDKKVQLVVRGEKTELDKRMIDELGDPLLHLVRNSLDHGLEPTDERQRIGKSDTGTIVLEAYHSGNNVLIVIRDDGAGLNVERIRARIAERNLVGDAELGQMTDRQIIEYIWDPGFSTADEVTDISGRGVGMDIVRKRITELNGTIDVESEAGRGTSFRIRLPLTLAIIRSLLVRFRDGLFSIPIDDVREVVSIPEDQAFRVHKHQTIDVRGEFIPLGAMSNVFSWHNVDYRHTVRQEVRERSTSRMIKIVILHSAGKTLGLCVDELLGGADIVIKSLSDNFVAIRGLSGASVMGDGTVCLMLDTSALIDMAGERSLRARA